MTSLALLFVGSVLLLNGLGLLGLASPKATAPINAFIGISLVTTVLWIVLPVRGATDADLATVLGAVGFLLFAFTYLYVALNNFAGLPGEGLGWYCGWAVLISLFLSWINFDRLGDPKFGTIWLSWALLFSAFFAVLALGLTQITRATGWLTVLQAFTTCTLPGAMLLTGDWTDLPTTVVVIAQIAVALIFAGLSVASRRSEATEPVPAAT